MTQKNIFTGSRADDGTGDVLRDAFISTQSNFNELFSNQALHLEAVNSYVVFTSTSAAAAAGAGANAYADSLNAGGATAGLSNTVNLSFNTANLAYNLGNNIVSGAQSLSNSTLQNVNSIALKYNPYATFDNTAAVRFWSRFSPSANIMFMQQNDDNFVFYSTNPNYTPRSIWSVYANSSNSTLRVTVPLQLEKGIKLANFGAPVGKESFGNTGDILVTGGGYTADESIAMWHAPQSVSVKMFNAKGDGVTDDTAAIQTAINTTNSSSTGSKSIYFPKGTYIISSPLDLKGKRIGLVGAGLTETVIFANTTMNVMIDMNESSAGNTYPFFIEKLSLNGNSNKANNGIIASYRTDFTVRDVLIDSCANGVVYAKSTLGAHENLRVNNSSRVAVYVGNKTFLTNQSDDPTCDELVFNKCIITGNTSLGVRVTAAKSVSFNYSIISNLGNRNGSTPSLTFEDAKVAQNGTSVMIGGSGSSFSSPSVSFNSCSLGDTCMGSTINIVEGLVNIRGGQLYCGLTNTSYLMTSVYGVINVDGASILPSNFFNHDILANRTLGSGLGGKISFRNCRGGTYGTGNYSLVGDVLNYGPMGRVFTPRLGKNYSTVSASVTSTVTTNGLNGGNSKRFTILSSSAANSYIGASASLTGISDIRSNENMSLVVVYSSMSNVAVRLTTTSSNGAPVSLIGVMPNTNSQTRTYVKLNTQYPIDNKTYGFLEFHSDPGGQSSTWFQIDEVYFTDNHVLNAGQTGYGVTGQAGAGGDWQNLHKC